MRREVERCGVGDRVGVDQEAREGDVGLQDVQQLEAKAGAVDGEHIACSRQSGGTAGGVLEGGASLGEGCLPGRAALASALE